jgi:molybdopterin-containing oxidoreductase family membrane subunit
MIEAGYLFSGVVLFFLDGRQDAALLLQRGARWPMRWALRAWASGYHDTPSQRWRHRRVTFWLSLGVLPMLVIAHATLGFVFGIQGGRPGWFSAHQAPAFVILAGLSGTATLVLVALGLRWLFRLHDRMPDESFRWLSNALWILAAVYLFFLVVETLTATYAAPEADRRLASEILTGHFAPLFWLTLGNFVLTFVIPFQAYLRKKHDIPGLAIAAVIVNVAAVSRRMLIVIPSQTHGALIELERGSYSPTWVEYGPILGLACMVLLLLVVFGRVFPLVPSAHRPIPDGTAKADGWPRWVVAWSAIVVGHVLVVVGLSDSFRLWSGGEVDNRIPFSPMIFAGGVMLLFASALFFELVPESKRKQAS